MILSSLKVDNHLSLSGSSSFFSVYPTISLNFGDDSFEKAAIFCCVHGAHGHSKRLY